jgi:hypothetical protein
MKYGILSDSYVYGNTITDDNVISGFVAPLSIISNQPAYAQDSANLRRRASSQGVQRWEIQASLDPTNNSAVNLVHSSTYGASEPFYIRMPQVYGLTISTSGSATLVEAAAKNSETLKLDKALTPGEFINIGDSAKVYLVKESSPESTWHSVKILPRLTTAAALSATVKRGGNVVMWAYYDTDTQIGITYVDGILSDQGSLKFIEKLA